MDGVKASLVMPWRDLGCPHRRAAFEFVTAYWERHLPDIEVVVDGGPEPFSRAAALNAAISKARGDVLFEIGPDGLIPPPTVLAALGLAADADGLVLCHTRYVHLTAEATERLYALGLDADLDTFGPDDAEAHGSTAADVGCFSRATWEKAGGYDERFGVWGGDDAAFALACGTLVGEQRRMGGPWIHLWHPRLPQSEVGHPEYLTQFAILTEYVNASVDPDAMRLLVER